MNADNEFDESKMEEELEDYSDAWSHFMTRKRDLKCSVGRIIIS